MNVRKKPVDKGRERRAMKARRLLEEPLASGPYTLEDASKLYGICGDGLPGPVTSLKMEREEDPERFVLDHHEESLLGGICPPDGSHINVGGFIVRLLIRGSEINVIVNNSMDGSLVADVTCGADGIDIAGDGMQISITDVTVIGDSVRANINVRPTR